MSEGLYLAQALVLIIAVVVTVGTLLVLLFKKDT